MSISERVKFLLEFTERWSADTYLNLCAIPAGGGSPQGHSWRVGDLTAQAGRIESWIAQRHNTHNVYFTINPLASAVDKKPTKADLAHCMTVCVDIDPNARDQSYKDAQDEILDLADKLIDGDVPFVIFSGNGLGAFWQTPEFKSVSIADAEAVSRSLHDEFAAMGFVLDGTWNADRLMRLPETLNYPSPKKLSKGYPKEPSQSAVLRSGPAAMSAERWQELLTRVPVPKATTPKARPNAAKSQPTPQTPPANALAEQWPLVKKCMVWTDLDEPLRGVSRPCWRMIRHSERGGAVIKLA